MFSGLDKAIVAAFMSIMALLNTAGVNIPAWAGEDWITALVAAATPILVYVWPNKGAGGA